MLPAQLFLDWLMLSNFSHHSGSFWETLNSFLALYSALAQVLEVGHHWVLVAHPRGVLEALNGLQGPVGPLTGLGPGHQVSWLTPPYFFSFFSVYIGF